MNEILLNDINTFSQYITTFLFILLRTSIFIILLPIIGDKQLPAQFKIGLAVFISLLLTPVVKFSIEEKDIPFVILKEFLIAVALGLTVRFVFMAVNMAGAFISHAMGMSLARVFNPEVGQSTYIAETYGVMTMLIFLSMDAHHDLLYVFVKSFEILPSGHLNIKSLVPEVMSLVSRFFILALKISAPVVVGLLISHLLTGFLYKAAPQMNIFFITLPLNIFLGFLLIILSIPVFEYVLNISLIDLRDEMARIITLAKG